MASADESVDLSSTIESNTEEVYDECSSSSCISNVSTEDTNPDGVNGQQTTHESPKNTTQPQEQTQQQQQPQQQQEPQKPQIALLNLIAQSAKDKLAQGILDTYQPDLTTVHGRVTELLRNQEVLQESTGNELTALGECTMLKDIGATFEQVKQYHKKLVNIKKEMAGLAERSQRVKVRAHKLQVLKQRDDLEAASEKEKQLKYEKELMAKPAARSSKP